MSRPSPANYSEKNKLTDLLNDAANGCYNANAVDVASYLARHFTKLSTTDALHSIAAHEVSDGCGGTTLQLSLFLAGDSQSAPSAVVNVSHSHGLTNIHPSEARVMAFHNDKTMAATSASGGSAAATPSSDAKSAAAAAGASASGGAMNGQQHALGEATVKMIQDVMVPALQGVSVSDQQAFDDTLVVTDGTANFYNLLAHVAASISMGAVLAASRKFSQPVYSLVALMKKHHVPSTFAIPLPIVTLFSTEPKNMGKVRIREVTLIPLPSSEKLMSKSSSLCIVSPALISAFSHIYETAQAKLTDDGQTVSVNMDGGIRYNAWENLPAVVDFTDDVLKESGYQLGKDFGLGLTIDAGLCYKADTQRYGLVEGTEFSGGQLAEFVANFCKEKKGIIVYLEDTHNDHDITELRRTMAKIGDKVTLAGNNIYAGNLSAIRRGVTEKATNNCVIRLNDCATVSNAIAAAVEFEQYENATLTVGAERYEGNPAFTAAFAVGVGARFISIGGLMRSEHAAVLNQLTMIATDLEAEGLLEESSFDPQEIPQVELPPAPTEPVVEVTVTKDKKKK